MQKQIIKLFWRFSRYNSYQRNLALLFPIFAVVVNVIIAPYVLSQFIDRLQAGDITLAGSWDLIAIYAALIFTGEVLLWRLALYFCWTFEIKGQKALYQAIFDKLSREDLSFHANRFGGSLVSQSTKMIGAFERFWDMIIWSIMPMVTTIVGSIVALTILGLWQYALFLLIYAIVYAVAAFLGSSFLAERNRKEASTSNRTSGFLADMVTNVATVKAFGREKQEYQSATRHINTWLGASTRLKWGIIGTTSAFSAIYAGGAVVAFIYAAYGAENGVVSAGLAYLIFIYALNINRQLWEMNNVTRAYNRAIGDADEMTQVLLKDYELVDNSSAKLRAGSGNVEFRGVTFTHDNGEGEQVFRDFNLSIPAGQRVGVVGRSGSGKTTLTRILLRFSDIDSGQILIDGQNISEISQKSLHEAISYVSQEPMLFHRSLSENISYGRADATRQQIMDAARRAHALDFIKTMSHGLDTLVGERGVKLSGGQRQRIAIARAILKNAPILVLDEATSALDSESEKMIQASLDELMKGRTSIVIAHRLSTIAKLDRIIVLDDGKIVEDDSHAELLRNGGIYAKLWSHQSGGFIED